MSILNEPRLISTQEQRNNLRRWIDALRSGEYKQVRGFLYSPSGYCGLGIAARLFESARLDRREFRYAELENLLLLNGSAIYGDVGICVHINDDEELSFNEIADIIEDYLNLLVFIAQDESYDAATVSNGE